MKEEYFIYLGVFAVILIMLILNSYVFNKIRMTEGLETMDTNSSKEDSTENKILLTGIIEPSGTALIFIGNLPP